MEPPSRAIFTGRDIASDRTRSIVVRPPGLGHPGTYDDRCSAEFTWNVPFPGEILMLAPSQGRDEPSSSSSGRIGGVRRRQLSLASFAMARQRTVEIAPRGSANNVQPGSEVLRSSLCAAKERKPRV